MSSDMAREETLKRVGRYLFDRLPMCELLKVFEHEKRVIEPESEVILCVPITLFELRALQNCGKLVNGDKEVLL